MPFAMLFSILLNKDSPRIWTRWVTYFGQRTVSKCDTSRELKKHSQVSTSSAITIKYIWSPWEKKDMDQSWDPAMSLEAVLDQPTTSQLLYLWVRVSKSPELIIPNTTDHRHRNEPSQDQPSPEHTDHADWGANKCLLLQITKVLWLFVTQHYSGSR